MEWALSAFALPAEDGPHLSTQEGWEAELA